MKKEQKIHYEPIDNLTPYDKNAKKHPKKQIEKIAESIDAFGFNQPIVVDKDNIIIVGHGRFEAAKLLKMEEVPVITRESLTEQQVKAYRLADNKLNESPWDMNLAIEELENLDPDMFELTGFDPDLLMVEDDEEELPPLPEETDVKVGDIYKLGKHRVMCGDSTNKEHLEKLLEGGVVDVLLTDPPYGVNYSSKNEFLNKFDKGNRVQEDIENDNIENYKEWFYTWLKHLPDYLNGVFYIFISGKEIHNLINAVKEADLKYSQDIVWVKNNHVLSRLDYSPKHENIIYGWANKNNSRGKFNTTVIDEDIDVKELKKKELIKMVKQLRNALKTTVKREQRRRQNDLHSTMKPVDLLKDLLFDSSEIDDKILDLFLGSGSTLIAAEQSNRICYGMELSPIYVDRTIKRWENFTGNEAEKIV